MAPGSAGTSPPRGSSSRRATPFEDLALGAVLKAVWGHKFQLLLVVVSAGLFGVGVSFLLPKTYVGGGSFVGLGGSSISLPSNLGALADVAGGLGLLQSGERVSLSPQFYSALLTSDAILEPLAGTNFPDSSLAGAPLRPLTAILEVSGQNQRDTLERAVRALRSDMVVDLNARTGIVSFGFAAPRAYLAKSVSDSLLSRLNVFITQNLRFQAAEERRFLEDRLAALEEEVQQKQDVLRDFYEANRVYENSPGLVFQEAVLRRDLEIKQSTFASVAGSLEEARINEVKDTPLITVIDPPTLPGRPRQPRPLQNGFILALFSPLVWLAWILRKGVPRVTPVDGLES
jgi:uncharacterized protein involved in exopolysaccharide biosynthesis